jgi:predicted Na+-dependent transporter
VTGAIMIPASLGIVLRMLRIHILQFLAAVWRPILASALMYLLVLIFVRHRLASAPSLTDNVVTLMTAILAGMAIYASGILALWFAFQKPPGAEQQILGKLPALLARIGLGTKRRTG